MKNMIFVLAAICALQTTAFADEQSSSVACASTIAEKATRVAARMGDVNCNFSEPEVGPGAHLRGASGTISGLCMHHISAISVEREPVTLEFSVEILNGMAPLNCATSVSVSATVTEGPQQAPFASIPLEIRPVISGSNRVQE